MTVSAKRPFKHSAAIAAAIAATSLAGCAGNRLNDAYTPASAQQAQPMPEPHVIYGQQPRQQQYDPRYDYQPAPRSAPLYSRPAYIPGACPLETKVLRWGFNNLVGMPPQEGCYWTQRWAVPDANGVFRVEMRTTDQVLSARSEAACMAQGAALAPVADAKFSAIAGMMNSSGTTPCQYQRYSY